MINLSFRPTRSHQPGHVRRISVAISLGVATLPYYGIPLASNRPLVRYTNRLDPRHANHRVGIDILSPELALVETS
jgi:hypothetical protein